MRQHRYKAKFSGASTHHRYANLSTWMFGGLIITGLFMFLFIGPSKKISDWTIFGFMLLTLIPLFVFKLLAQDRNVFGKIISVTSGFLSLAFLVSSLYFVAIGAGIQALMAALYYGILAWLSYGEYQEIQHP